MDWGRSFSPEEEKELFPQKPKTDGRKKYRDLLAKVKVGDRKLLPLQPGQKVQGVKLQLGTVAKELQSCSLEYGQVVTEEGRDYLPVKVLPYVAKSPPDPNRPKRVYTRKTKPAAEAAS